VDSIVGPFLDSVSDRFGFVSAVMEISIHSLLDGATRAIGTVAVIDVFRAFTTAAVALANGASRIVMVRTVRGSAGATRNRLSARSVWVRFEAGHRMDSTSAIRPTRSLQSTSTARRSSSEPALVRRESSPQTGPSGQRLYAASLVTAEATVRALLSGSPDHVSLVAMGDNGIKRTDEDELCAIHLRNRLEGRPGDADAIRRLILAGGEVGRFHDPARPYLHPEDVDIALDIDRYDFAVRVNFEDGRPVARIETPAVTMPKSPILAPTCWGET